ncbi:MAG: AlpA family phage regulatory protein [Gammaproteobacteria bacterium]|nr:AlpA family phage regulatory protein [Gammaproteobacteria bacterium]
MDDVRLFRVRDVCERVGLSRSQVYRLLALDRFPKPVPLGGKTVRWRSDELADWIEQRSADRK